MKKLLASLLFLFVGEVCALDMEQNPEIERLFDELGVKGSFVLYNVSADRVIVMTRSCVNDTWSTP